VEVRRAPIYEFVKLDDRISYWDRLPGMHCVAKMGLPHLVRHLVGAGVNPLALDGDGHSARSRAEIKLHVRENRPFGGAHVRGSGYRGQGTSAMQFSSSLVV
jgi:hypothetical protein